ncbi:hypothetical protein KFL_002250160 [Klebsormidium nitens]|uniref:Uncharacterized protein n=1 Tax=Klebsormidium nitens TaxID=105231 RepID=A0A1Y1I965_KLENI|nr:hypothetical protein KFL_002250160 [Klebsormidium nitens]|eukprot:GAQ85236.1 hypothetical protein KFL_002250160 [Klebsormidium nitens]
MASAACRLPHCGGLAMCDLAPQFKARPGAKQGRVCCRLNAVTFRSPLLREFTSFTSSDILNADKVESKRSRQPYNGGRADSKVRAAAGGEEGVAAKTADKTQLLNSLKEAIETKDSELVKGAIEGLKEAGYASLWNSTPNLARRTVYTRELATMGIKNPEALAIPTSQNDLAFLVTVVGVTSVVAVAAGFLPGDWGFFVPYLVGGISLAVLAVGSVAPGLLQVATSQFGQLFPNNRERVAKHEAAHFLVAYMLGIPITGYSLDIGREHTNLVDFKLQKRLLEGLLNVSELERLSVVAMAGLAAEGLNFDKVEGQTADLMTLQRLINRTKPKLSNNEQQNLTRWATYYAASVIKNNKASFDALVEALSRQAPVEECVAAIEAAAK